MITILVTLYFGIGAGVAIYFLVTDWDNASLWLEDLQKRNIPPAIAIVGYIVAMAMVWPLALKIEKE